MGYVFMMPTKCQNKCWVAKDGGIRQAVLKPGFASRKNMFTIFFDAQGPVAVEMLPKGKHINGKYYKEKVLPTVIEYTETHKPDPL